MVSALHVVPSLDERMGGSVRAPLNVSLYLEQAGVRSEIAATAGPDDALSYLTREYPAVTCHTFPRARPTHNFRSPELYAWLKRRVRDYDLVEIHGIFTFAQLYAARACRSAGVPYVVRPHGQLEPHDLLKHAALKRLVGPTYVRWLLSGSAGVLFTTERESSLNNPFGAAVVPHVVALPVQQSVATGDPVGFRSANAIPHDAVVVLFLGRFDHKKGLDLLIPALSRVMAESPDLWFVLAGAGDPAEEADLRTLIERHHIQERTVNCGFLSGTEKQSAYEAADVFALPSRNENFGIVVVEAMYAGVALLLSNEVYVHDVPQRAGAAQICQPTEASCEAALRAMLSNREALREMGVKAREAAFEHYSPGRATDALLTVYEAVLGAPRDGLRGE